jgi:alanine dehydrogenase
VLRYDTEPTSAVEDISLTVPDFPVSAGYMRTWAVGGAMTTESDTREALFLTAAETEGLADPSEYVDAVREGYRQRGEGAPAKPRTAIRSPEPAGRLNNYVTILPESEAMGGYTYATGFESSSAWFITPLFDARTGEPLAILDGIRMNPFKTGAVGAVGVDALAREDATTMAVIGSGKQARGQVLASVTVRDFRDIRVYSPTPDHREAFAADIAQEVGPNVTTAGTASEAVADADVVITATRATEPVFDGEDLPAGAHVTAMGQYAPGNRELDATTIARAKYVPDLRKRAFRDAGAFLQAMEAGVVSDNHVHAELGDVVAGRLPGRESPDDITVFDSGGTAIETVAAADLLYRRAREAGRGTPIEFTSSM